MKTSLPLEEVNRLREFLTASYDADKKTFYSEKDGCIDAVLEILIMAYIYGTNNTNKQLKSSVLVDEDAAKAVIMKSYDGKNFADRVSEYFDGGDLEEIVRVADTDSHRVFCAAQLNAARRGGAKRKTWIAMRDGKVRETHEYIDGITVDIDDLFYTIDNDEAPYPGGFSKAQNNVNCRCILDFTT